MKKVACFRAFLSFLPNALSRRTKVLSKAYAKIPGNSGVFAKELLTIYLSRQKLCNAIQLFSSRSVCFEGKSSQIRDGITNRSKRMNRCVRLLRRDVGASLLRAG